MTSILEELFYGNVCPGTDFRSKDAKTRKLMAHLADHHEALGGNTFLLENIVYKVLYANYFLHLELYDYLQTYLLFLMSVI